MAPIEKNPAEEVDLHVQERHPKPKEPPLYRVFLKNDDYTPMEFVVYILEVFFAMDPNRAINTMLEVHNKGRGICGTFPFDIAVTKVQQVNTYARANQHPLLCDKEKA